MNGHSQLLTPEHVATMLHCTKQALSQRRYLGTGPKFIKVGSRVLYRLADVEAFLDSNTMTRTDDRPVSA